MLWLLVIDGGRDRVIDGGSDCTWPFMLRLFVVDGGRDRVIDSGSDRAINVVATVPSMVVAFHS